MLVNAFAASVATPVFDTRYVGVAPRPLVKADLYVVVKVVLAANLPTKL